MESLRKISKELSIMKFNVGSSLEVTILEILRQGYKVSNYRDKNIVFQKNQDVQNTGLLLLRQGKYDLAEKYWIWVSDFIDQFSKKYKTKFNHGISTANAAIAQIAQGRYAIGSENLLKAYTEDRDFLKSYGIEVGNPKEAFSNSPLFIYHEGKVWDDLYIGLVKRHVLSRKFLDDKKFDIFIHALDFEERVHFFLVLNELRDSLAWNRERNGNFTRGKVLQSIFSLCRFFEHYLRKYTNTEGKFQHILETHLNGQGYSVSINQATNSQTLESKSLSELDKKIRLYSRGRNEIEKIALTTLAFRNFSGHNYSTLNKISFYKRAIPKYISNIISLIGII